MIDNLLNEVSVFLLMSYFFAFPVELDVFVFFCFYTISL